MDQGDEELAGLERSDEILAFHIRTHVSELKYGLHFLIRTLLGIFSSLSVKQTNAS